MSISSNRLFPAGLFSPKRWGLLLAFAICFSAPSRTQSVVDCAGTTPGAFTTINAAVSSAGPGTFILVTGPCNEDVSLSNQTNIFLGAWYGTRATVSNQISVSGSHGVYLYDWTFPVQRALEFRREHASLILDSCTSNGSAANGLISLLLKL
jgi:hypothetical protein